MIGLCFSFLAGNEGVFSFFFLFPIRGCYGLFLMVGVMVCSM